MAANTVISPKIRGHHITGNLVNDPELIQIGNNKQMVTFRVAENHRARDAESGQWQDIGATYYDVAISMNKEDLARNVLSSLRQGNRVSVAGTYDAKPYLAANGEVGMNHRIMADEVSASLAFNQVRIGPNARNSAQATSTATAQNTATTEQNVPAAPDTDFDASM